MKNKWTDFLGKTWEFDDMGIAISNGTLIPPGEYYMMENI